MAVEIRKSWLLSTNEAYKLVADVAIDFFDEEKLNPATKDDVWKLFWFTPFPVSSPQGHIRTILGTEETPFVGEFSPHVNVEDEYWPTIGYGTKRTFPSRSMSSEVQKWITQASKNMQVSAPLLEDLKRSFDWMRKAIIASRITFNKYKALIFTEWFANITNEYWFGSQVYDGQALFSQNHTVAKTWETYSNIIEDDTTATNYGALTYSHLSKAIDRLRRMKDGLGNTITLPKNWIYDLYVPTRLERTAGDILNMNGERSPYTYSGTEANNDNYENVFNMRDWFRVRLNVVEIFDQPTNLVSSKRIWNDTMWFLVNKTLCEDKKALIDINLWAAKMKMYEDDRTNVYTMSYDEHKWAEALYPECFVGSLWIWAIPGAL